MSTDGVFVIGSEVRGPVDTRADSDYTTGFFTAGRRQANWHASVRGAGYTEERGNGTPVQVNSTDWQQFSLEAGGFVGGGVLEVHAVGSSQDYYQTFSAVAAAGSARSRALDLRADDRHLAPRASTRSGRGRSAA